MRSPWKGGGLVRAFVDAKNRAQHGGLQDGLRASLCGEGSSLEQEEVVRESRGEGQVVGDTDDGLAGIAREFGKDFKNAELVGEVEVGRGLVQQQDGGVLGECTREGDALVFAGAELRDAPFSEGQEFGQGEGRLEGVAVSAWRMIGIVAMSKTSQGHGVLDAEIEGGWLKGRDDGHAECELRAGNGAHGGVFQEKLSTVGKQSGQGSEEGCFSRTVWTEDCGQSLLGDLEIKVPEEFSRPAPQLAGFHGSGGGSGRGIHGCSSGSRALSSAAATLRAASARRGPGMESRESPIT
ncbi:MAG: hypothetical protein RLZZ142_2698 [Verrucomicrobiota bacterium]